MQKSNNNNQNYKGGNGLNNEQQNFNNNNNNNNIDLFQKPLALSASNNNHKGVWKGSGMGSGGSTMVDAFGLQGVQAPQGMVKQQQTTIQQQTMIMGQGGQNQFGDLSTVPVQFGAIKSMQQQPISVPGPDLDDFSDFKSEAIFFVPSKCIGLNGGGLQSTPAMYNELTSVVVDESPKQVLEKFKSILSTFSNDIDYQIDEENYIINGQIFIRHFAVFFKISIWDEQSENRTRFEFRRSKGDTVGFTEFWNEIEDILYDKFTNAKGEKNNMDNDDDGYGGFDGDDGMGLKGLGGLPPLDYNFNLDSMDDMEMDDDDENTLNQQDQGLTKQDLDNFVEDIQICDPSVVYSIAMLLDAFKVQTQFIQMVFNHTTFIKCIIENALNHQDTALVRGALITLERLCDSASGADALIGYNVLDRVVPLLQHKTDLIRKYAVRLLSKLSSAKSWKFDNDKLRRFASLKVKECQSKWENCRFATNDFIQQQMYENINAKLVMTK